MKPTYIIFVETVSGEIVQAFTWTRDEASGVEAGKKRAEETLGGSVRVWAKRIENAI